MMEVLRHLALTLAGCSKEMAIAVIACGIVWTFEVWKPAADDLGASGRLRNLAIYGALLLGLVALGPVYGWVGQQLRNVALIDRLPVRWPTDGILRAVLATFVYALVWDFFQYWKHRAEHTFRVLWIFHRVHHDDPAMNASTAVRHSFGGAGLSFVLVHIPTMVICGGGLLPFAGAIVLFSGWGYLNHANVRVQLGPLTSVVSGPQLHRLHHGRDSHYFNSNYAAFFPVFDLIFGTLRLPKKREWPETGLNNFHPSDGVLAQVFLPWKGNERVEPCDGYETFRGRVEG